MTETENGATPKLKEFSAIIMESFRGQAVRNAEAANEKLEKLAGLLVQVAFGLGGLASVRLPGNSFTQLPLTYLGIIGVAISILCGVVWYIFDFKFFADSATASRDVASKSLGTFLYPTNEEKQARLRSSLDDHERLPNKTTHCPLILQFILLFTSFILIMVELRTVGV